MLKQILHNFYLRNICVQLTLVSVVVVQRLTLSESINFADILVDVATMSTFYVFAVFHNLVLYKKILLRKRYLSYLLLFIGILISIRLLNNYIASLPQNATPWRLLSFKEWIGVCWADVIYIYLGLALYSTYLYFKEREDALNTAYLKRELELKQLKEQLNPHFLFNALNNIYSYSLENNAQANELIMKLSELMRFILKEAPKEKISISEEIQFIENYIAFERERLGTRCTIQFIKYVDSPAVEIAPFILFSFIENAFKHGTNSIRKSSIDINLYAAADEIILEVNNPVFRKENYTSSTAIGLGNTRRRLELLYPGRYSLNITDNGNRFTIALSLKPVQEISLRNQLTIDEIVFNHS